MSTRTKNVVSDSQVGHLWANKLQDEARVAHNNFYFQGDTIYSYGSHFPIARHFTANGENFVLFTLRGYSNTTSKHIQLVRSAASHLTKVYVYDMPYSVTDSSAHTENMRHWFSDIQNEINSLKTARKPEIYVGRINETKGYIETYRKYFDVKLTKEQEILYSLTDTEEMKNYAKAAKEREAKALAAVLKIGRPVVKKMTDIWRNYQVLDPNQFTEKQRKAAYQIHQMDENDSIVRLRTDGKTVETSKGVTVPVSIAKRAYQFYMKIIVTGGCSGDCQHTIAGYEVKAANDKQLVVGCHDISRAEIDYIALKLGW